MNNTNKFKAVYALLYAPIGVLTPLIGQYLSGIGFSGTQIGTVTAVGVSVAIFAQAFWGEKYSNARDGRKVIFLVSLAAAAMALVNSMIFSFVLFTIGYGVMYFFQGPVMGLCDAMVLEQNENFAAIRLCGAVGYAIAVFSGGKIGEAIGLGNIFYIYAVTFILGGCILMTIKASGAASAPQNPDGKPDCKPEKVSYKELLTNRKVLELIFVGIFVFGTNVANNTYFSFLYRDGGGTVAGVGTAFLLMVGSEAPFMALAPKLSKKFTQEKTILAAMVLSALRFGWYGFGPSHEMLLVTFFLQGMVNGIILVEYVKYLSAVIDVRLIGIAVSAFYAVSSNGGSIICNFFGGLAMDYFGSVGVYVLFSALNVIGIVLYILFGLHKNARKVIIE